MMNKEPHFNTWIGNSELVATINSSLNCSIEIVVAVPIKDTPDLVKTRVPIRGLISNLVLRQLDDFVR
jgi:hypothetical protein